MSECRFAHTTYQLDKVDKCPMCGETGISCVGYTVGMPEDCALLHVDDHVYCESCGEFMTGAEFSERTWINEHTVDLKLVFLEEKRKLTREEIAKIKNALPSNVHLSFGEERE